MPRLDEGRSPFPRAEEDPSTVLVVEDDELIRLVTCDYLRECRFNVFGAATVAEAIDILQSAGTRIDLVFSDIRLSGELDGIHLARWVRQNRGAFPSS